MNNFKNIKDNITIIGEVSNMQVRIRTNCNDVDYIHEETINNVIRVSMDDNFINIEQKDRIRHYNLKNVEYFEEIGVKKVT